MNFDNYECDGQLNIADYLSDQRKRMEEKYQIPRNKKWQREEGWSDDWHYTELETPPESKVYYTIHQFKNSYIYGYSAWAKGFWWYFDSYGKKWNPIRPDLKEIRIPFAWVEIPGLYMKVDTSLHEMLEHTIEKLPYWADAPGHLKERW